MWATVALMFVKVVHWLYVLEGVEAKEHVTSLFRLGSFHLKKLSIGWVRECILRAELRSCSSTPSSQLNYSISSNKRNFSSMTTTTLNFFTLLNSKEACGKQDDVQQERTNNIVF